jgi:hypothetical protein
LSLIVLFLFRDRFIGDQQRVRIEGRVICAEEVLIEVAKVLETRRDPRGRLEVRGASYIYHAWHQPSGRQLFRYCTAHGLADLHVHRYDLQTGDETEQPRIALDQLPTLSDAILEAVELAQAIGKA